MSILEVVRSEAPAFDVCVERIDPVTARRYLLRLLPGQRKLRAHRVAQYARDMKAGNWSLNHQGIAFDAEGHLIDGQHRLAAVVEAGVEVEMMVSRGIPAQRFLGMDRGMLRSPYENAPDDWMASRKAVSAARSMMLGWEGLGKRRGYMLRPTDFETFDFMERHRESLEFVLDLFRSNRSGISQSSVLAAFARAFYSADREFLTMCAEALQSGILPSASFSGMGALRSFLTSSNNRNRSGGEHQREVFAKTERALSACLRGEPVKVIRAAAEELFPIPA